MKSLLPPLFCWFLVFFPHFFLLAQVAQSLNAFVVNNATPGVVFVLNILPELNMTVTATSGSGTGGGVNLAATISVPNSDVPSGVAVTPNGQYAYVITSNTPYRIYQINAQNYAVTQVSLGSFSALANPPVGIVASPDSQHMYISDLNGLVTEITVSSNTFTTQIATGISHTNSICCNSSYVFLSSIDTGGGSKWRLSQFPRSPLSPSGYTGDIGAFTGVGNIGQIAIGPGTNFLYYLTAQYLSGIQSIFQVDVSGPIPVTIPITNSTINTSVLGSGSGGWQIAFAGSNAYVTSNNNTSIGYFPFPVSASTSLTLVPLVSGLSNPSPPVAIAADSSGKLLYVTFTSSNQLNIINAESVSEVGKTFLTSSITGQTLTSASPSSLIAIAPTPISKIQSATQLGLPGITGKITSSVSPGGTIAATVTNNTGSTVYITLATYTVGSSLGSGSASSNWLSTQTLSTPTSFQTFAVASGFSGALPAVTLTYPASGGFQLDLYQGTDPVNWAAAPVNGIVNLNLLDAQYKYP